MDKIDAWIENRFGTPNTFNRQLLDNFIEFLEKELGYVRKDDDQGLPDIPDPAKLKEIASQCFVEAKQELADEAKRIEEAKAQERKDIGSFIKHNGINNQDTDKLIMGQALVKK